MEQQKELTINTKDCIKYICSKWKSVLVVAVIFALMGAGVAVFHYVRQQDSVDALQTELEQQFVTEDEFYTSEADRINAGLENLDRRIDEQQQYLLDSIYLSNDEKNVLVTSVDIYVALEASTTDRNSFVDLCAAGIMGKTDWDSIGASCGQEGRYIKETVSAERDESSGLLNLRVYYPNSEISNMILDHIIANMDEICREYTFLGEPEFKFLNRTENYEAVDEIADKRNAEQKRYDSYVAERETVQAYLDAMDVPTYPTFKDDFWRKAVKKSIMLTIAAAFAGVVLMAILHYMRFVKKGVIYSPGEFRRLTDIEMLGRGDDIRNIAIKVRKQNKGKLLLLGKHSEEAMDAMAKQLNEQLSKIGGSEIIVDSVAVDADAYVEKLYASDAVVFVVECQKTMLPDIVAWKQYVEDAEKQIVGNIVM